MARCLIHTPFHEIRKGMLSILLSLVLCSFIGNWLPHAQQAHAAPVRQENTPPVKGDCLFGYTLKVDTLFYELLK